MAISIGADYYLNNAMTSQSATKADKLSSSLGGMDIAKELGDVVLLELFVEIVGGVGLTVLGKTGVEVNTAFGRGV